MDMQLSLEHRQAEFASHFSLSLDDYLYLVRKLPMTELTTVLELLKARNSKSSYRKYMQARVRRWIDERLPGPPLTPSEFKMLTPQHPIKWQLPR